MSLFPCVLREPVEVVRELAHPFVGAAFQDASRVTGLARVVLRPHRRRDREVASDRDPEGQRAHMSYFENFHRRYPPARESRKRRTRTADRVFSHLRGLPLSGSSSGEDVASDGEG